MNINDNMFNDLPTKLHPFCLGHSKNSLQECKQINQDEIFEIFKKSREVKANIFESEKWIFKTPRLEFSQTNDTHLYRVLKARKIHNYILKNNLQAHVVVPKKFIIKNPNLSGLSAYIVVSEKLKLSEVVIKPSDELETMLKTEVLTSNPIGQTKSFLEGKPQKELSIDQTKILAHLAFLGYTDQTYNNVYLTHENKVAIIDTEPMHRTWKKEEKTFFNIFSIWKKDRTHPFFLNLIFNNWIAGRFTYNETNEFGRKLAGTAYLKSYSSQNAKIEIDKIENSYYQKIYQRSLIRVLAGVVSSVAIFSFHLPAAPISTISLGTIAVLKTTSLISQVFQLNLLNFLNKENKLSGMIKAGCI